jgi:hypothetical protein
MVVNSARYLSSKLPMTPLILGVTESKLSGVIDTAESNLSGVVDTAESMKMK